MSAPTTPATTSPQAERAAPEGPRRGLRGRALVAVLVLLLVGVPVVAALLGTRASGRPLDPENPAPAGARAVAQLLGDAGVPVTRVTRAAQAADALAGDGPATLVVTDPVLLDPALLTDLTAAAAAVVLLGPDEPSVEATGVGLRLGRGSDASDEPLAAAARPVATDGEGDGEGDVPGEAGLVPADCDDADARAAGEATGGTRWLRATGDGAVVCFDGSYGVGTAPGGARVHVLDAPDLLSNELLDAGGNAALALRATGSQPRVVWLVASSADLSPDAAPDPTALLPGWVAPVALQLAVVGAALVVWRSRRFGALVTEPLPVVVRSVETVRGRAALYRASRDRAAAAAALRAAVRWRLQGALGLPPGTPVEVVAAGAAHQVRTGGGDARWGERAVHDLLAGPPPADDDALAALLRDLDALEAATHRTAAPSRPARPASPTPTEEHR